MLTVDRIQSAFADLAAGRIPDRDELAALVESWRRMQAGTSFEDAIGASGTIAKKERNAAIVKLAAGLTDSTWAQAEIIRLRLQLTATSDAARDAAALGARDLKREMLYLILRDAIKDEPDNNSAIAYN